jgi:hypothetical protein
MLSDCQIHLILQLTNIYETSHPEFDFEVCVQLQDNHGFSAGIIQFTTGTGSALQVINEYTKMKPDNGFRNYIQSLRQIATRHQQSGEPIGDVEELQGYCQVWKQEAQHIEFQEAQLLMLFKNYFVPALRLASQRSFSLPGNE